MTSYLDMARRFYAERPQLVEGMPDGPEALACILARQLADDLKKRGAGFRKAIAEDLDPGVAAQIAAGDVGAAFRKCPSTMDDRLGMLRAEIRDMLESLEDLPAGLSPERIRAAEAHLRNDERRDVAAARKMALTLSQATDAYWNSVLDFARLNADGPTPDLARLVEEAREAECEAAALIGEGVHEVLAFAPLVDGDSYTLASDHDPANRRTRAGEGRSLLRWRPEDLAVHYPKAADRAERAAEIAARAAYPFGLQERESVATMVSAVLLVHGVAAGALIRKKAAQARQTADGNPMAAAAQAHARHRESSSVFSGLDFVRILGGALAVGEGADGPHSGSRWPQGVLKELLRGGAETDAGPELLGSAMPLREEPDWTDNIWESVGRQVEDLLHRDLVAQRGGAPAPREGEDLEEAADGDDGTGLLYTAHSDHARTSIRMLCLHEFRNVLVNTETGKATADAAEQPEDGTGDDGAGKEREPRAFERQSLVNTNSFLSENLHHHAGRELGRFRKISEKVLVGIRTAHRHGTHPGAAIPSGRGHRHHEDPLPERLTAALHKQSREAMRAAGLEPGAPLESIADLGIIPATVMENRRLAGTESPETVDEAYTPEGEPLWLVPLKSDAVGRRLAELSTAPDTLSYIPATEAGRAAVMVPLSGRLLREAAQTLRAFVGSPSTKAASAETLQAALEYAAKVWKGEPERTQACLHLAAGLILDAYTTQEN